MQVSYPRLFIYIFPIALSVRRFSIGFRLAKDQAQHLRRSDEDSVSGTIPMPDRNASVKISSADLSGTPISGWSALLEQRPPPWWTPSSPSRMYSNRARTAPHGPGDTEWWRKYDHVAVEVGYNNLGEEILTFPERRPYLFNVMLATFKTWTADAFVQFLHMQKGLSKGFDWGRSVAFAFFGLIYVGLVQWFLYITVLTWLFPDATIFANMPLSIKLRDRTGMYDMVGQIFVDVCCFMPFIYFPVFYIIKAMFQESGSFMSRAKGGLGRCRANFYSDAAASACLWMPADVFIFAAPMYLRMPLEHLVSFGWTMFMSVRRGPSQQAEVKLEATMDILKQCEAAVKTKGPELVKVGGAVFQLNVGAEKVNIDLKNDDGSMTWGEADSDVTITVADVDFQAIAAGKLDGMQAFVAGKVKVEGNMVLAQKLGPILECAKNQTEK